MNLYRIISLETFIDLLHNKRERYVRPETWDDNYEGYLFGKIENSKDRRKIIEDVYYNVCPRNYTATINNLLKLEHGKYFVYGQCWSTLSDSDALWRIYSYSHHAIQIKTTDVRIKNLLKTKADILYEIRKVKYDVEPEDNLMHEQVMQLKEAKIIYEPFFHKRKAFKHEAEVRVLVDDTCRNQVAGMSSMGATWKIDEKMEEISQDVEKLNEIEKRLTGDIQCLSPAKKYKLYKSSINKSIHFVQRSLSSSTKEKKCLSLAKKYKLYKSSINKSIHFVQRSLSSSTRE